MKQMTKTEALQAGYTSYGYDELDFQQLYAIESLIDEDFDNPRGNLMLADQQAHYLATNADDLRYLVTDDLISNSEYMDDTDEIPDLLKKHINWDEMADKINAVCQKKQNYFLTDIQLVNDK